MNRKSEVADEISSGRKTSSGKKRSKHTKNHEHGLVIISNKDGADGDYEKLACCQKHERKGDRKKHERSSVNDDVPKNDIAENDVSIKFRQKYRKEKSDKEKYNIEKYLEDTSNILGKYPIYNISSLSLDGGEMILKKDKKRNALHRENTTHFGNSKINESFHEPVLHPVAQGPENKRKCKKKLNTGEQSVNHLTQINTQVLFSHVKTKNPFKVASKQERDKENIKKSRKLQKNDECNHTKHSPQQCKHDSKSEGHLQEKIKAKREQKQSQKPKHPMYFGVYDKYFVLEKTPRAEVETKKKKQKIACSSKDYVSSKHSKEREKTKDKTSRLRVKHKKTPETSSLDRRETGKLDEELKTYLAKFQHLIDKKLEAILNIAKNKENVEETKEVNNRKRVNRRAKKERDTTLILNNTRESAKRNVMPSKVLKKKEDKKSSDFEKAHAILEAEQKSTLDRFYSTSKSSEFLHHCKHKSNEKRSHSSKSPVRKRRIEHYNSVENIPCDSLPNLKASRNNSTRAKSNKRKEDKNKSNFNINIESDIVEQKKVYKKSEHSAKNSLKDGDLEQNKGFPKKKKIRRYEENKKSEEKRSSYASEDQNEVNIHYITSKQVNKPFQKRNQLINDVETEISKLQRHNNRCKSAEKREIQEPHFNDRMSKREYHLQCQTVSVVGIPSQYQDDSAILTNIQTSTSLKMVNSEEEPVEKKKKTKRFKVYYKYSIDDNKLESGQSSGEKTVISDSHKKISDNSEEASECNYPEKEYEKQLLVPKTTKNKPVLENNHLHKRKYRVTPSIDLRLNNIAEERTSSDSKPISCKYFHMRPLNSSNSDYSLKVIKSPPKVSPRTPPDASNKARKFLNFDQAEIWNKNFIESTAGEIKEPVKWKKAQPKFVSKSDINISYTSLNRNNRVAKKIKSKSGIPIPKVSYLRFGKHSAKNMNQQCPCHFFNREHHSKNILREFVKEFKYREHLDQYDMYLLQCLELSNVKKNSEKKIGTETALQQTQATNISDAQQSIQRDLKLWDENDSSRLKHLGMPSKLVEKLDKNLGTEPEIRYKVNEKMTDSICRQEKQIQEKCKTKTVEIGVDVDLRNENIVKLQEPCSVKMMADAAVEAHILDASDTVSEDTNVEILFHSSEKKYSTLPKDSTKIKKTVVTTPGTECLNTSWSKSYTSPKVENQACSTPEIHPNITKGILKNKLATKEDFTQMSKESFQSQIKKSIALNTSLIDLRCSKDFIKGHFACIKTSKSEANLKPLNPEGSANKITSLICLHKFDTTRLSESTRSHLHLLDPYFKSIISDAPHKSTLFFTKTFKTNDMSSYQRRKLYDESIRRRMKKKMQMKLFKPPVYEVRFLTVERLSSQSNTVGMNSEPCRRKSFDSFSQNNQTIFTHKLRPFKQTRTNKSPYTRNYLTEVIQDVDLLSKTKKKALMNDTVQQLFRNDKTFGEEACSKTDTTYTALETNTEDSSLGTDRSSSLDSEGTKKQTSTKTVVEPLNQNFNQTSNKRDLESKSVGINLEDFNENLNTDLNPKMEKNINLLMDHICKSVIKYFETNCLSDEKETCNSNHVNTIFKSNNVSTNLNLSKIATPVVNAKDSDFTKTNTDIQTSVINVLSNLTSGPRFLDKNISMDSQKKSAFLGYAFDSSTTNQFSPKCESHKSEESGYSSHKSRTWSSVTGFFKKPHIAALLKPCSDSEIFEESKSWDTYEEMMKKCHDYAKKVRTESQRENKVNQIYQEISLDVMLGRASSSTLANFNSNCSLCREVSSLQAEGDAIYDSVSIDETNLKPEKEEDNREALTTDSVECNVIFSNTNLNTSCITLIDSAVVSNDGFNLPTKPQANEIYLENPLVGVIHVDIPEKLNSVTTKHFFENLISLYEKEVAMSTKLYKDNNFFENDLLTITTLCDASSDSTFSAKKKKGIKKIFGKLFGIKKEKSHSTNTPPICKTEENKFDTHQEETLKTLAQNARKYFTMFVQAVKMNREINDEIKICGLLKLLENMEKGQFTFLRGDTQFNFEEEIKKQVKESFNNIYKVAVGEASKAHRNLTVNDLKLIEAFVCKYRIGMLSKTDFIASSIGRGILRTENDLKVAVTYLMRQPTTEIDPEKFEEHCKLHINNP